mgnify:CR=1 FL=1
MTSRYYKTKLAKYGLTYLGIQIVPYHLGDNLVLWNDSTNGTHACKVAEFMVLFP